MTKKTIDCKLIIFDADGTLVDSLGQSFQIDSNLVRRHGGEIPNIEVYREAIAMGDWDRFYETFGITNPKIKKQLLDEYYTETARVPLSAMPYAIELLQFLRSIKKPTSVVSINKDKENVLDKLRKTDLLAFFEIESIRCSQTTKTKEIEDEYSRRGIHPTQTIMVGDTAKDITEAKEAGVKTAAIYGVYSYHTERMIRDSNPDYLFANLNELQNAII